MVGWLGVGGEHARPILLFTKYLQVQPKTVGKMNQYVWHVWHVWRAWSKRIVVHALLSILVLCAGCQTQISQSAFAHMASNASAAFAAAEATLRYEHAGKITSAYAESSFINYQSELSKLPQTLPAQSGAPHAQTLRHLLHVVAPALTAVAHPCLQASCGWRTQVAELAAASSALQKVSNS